MIQYTRSMVNMSKLSQKELSFLQRGVIFKSVKIGFFGMDAEALTKKEFYLDKTLREKKKTQASSPSLPKVNPNRF